MIQHGQVFKLKTRSPDGQPLWAYRYRLEGRGSERPQVGGFATRAEAEKALRKVLDRLGPGGGRATITLAEFVNEYLEMHQAAPGHDRQAPLATRQSDRRARREAPRGSVAEGRVRVAAQRSGRAPLRSNAGAAAGSQPRRLLGPHRLQPGQARRPQPGAAGEGEAAVRDVGA